MQITLKQLDTHRKQKLLPLYLISGDEPLLIQEARDAIFNAAKSHGFSNKEICHVETGFRAEILIELIQNQSLFSEKKLIDIRNPSAKIDAVMAAFFQHYFKTPADDRIIVMSTDKLSAAQQKSAWVELIKKHGVYLPIWPIRSSELPQWIMERAKQYQLKMLPDVARLLANFSEGHLLGAQQAIEKLQLLYPNAEITREQLITVLSDHARFSIFDLSESMMQNNPKKIMRIIARLEQTGEEPALVLWAICRKLRENGTSDKAKKALQYAAHVDEIIKGAKTGNVWQALLKLSLIDVETSIYRVSLQDI